MQVKRIVASVCRSCALAIAVSVSPSTGFAAVQTHVWDGASESYGDDVTVTYASGPGSAVSRIDVVAHEGDAVVFTGAQASFAANAVVCLKGLGALVFSNDVATAGALKLTSDLAGVNVELGRTLTTGGTKEIDLAGQGVVDVEKFSTEDFAIVGGECYYNTSSFVSLAPYHEKRTDGSYSVQLQNFNGAWSKCVKIVCTMQDGKLMAYCPYVKMHQGYQVNVLGADFDEKNPPDVLTYTTQYAGNLTFRGVCRPAKRTVVFGGQCASGGAFEISGGINLKVSGSGIGACACQTLTQAVKFAQGSLAIEDAGVFTNLMTVSGSDGELAYTSSDRPAPVLTTAATTLTVSGDDQVILANTELASIVAVTGSVSFLKRNGGGATETLRPEFQQPFGAMFYRSIGNELLVRFQAHSQWGGLAYGVQVVFSQVGRDVVVRKCAVYNEYEDWSPRAKDPWTWDYFNNSSAACNYDYANATVKDLVFTLSSPAGEPDCQTHMYYNVATTSGGSASRIRHVFNPGSNRKMTALIHGWITSEAGVIEVGDGAVVEFRSRQHSAADFGIWPNMIKPPKIIVHAGGHVFDDRQWQHSQYQTIALAGGKFAARDPEQDKAGGWSKYAFFKGKASVTYFHGFEYSDGGVSHGYDLYLGSSAAPNTELRVTGATACRAENGFLVYGPSKDTAEASAVFSLAVDDVVVGEAEDFTFNRPVRQKSDKALVSLEKTGAGTALMNAANNFFTNAPVVLKEGAVRMGKLDAFNADTDFAFAGGALEAAAAGDYALGEVTVSGDGTLALADGATIRFAASAANEWSSGTTLNITGDMTKSAVYFGEGVQGLTERQQRRLRLNGERCHLDDEGRVVPGGFGMILLFR